jgi:hypothetical protein
MLTVLLETHMKPVPHGLRSTSSKMIVPKYEHHVELGGPADSVIVPPLAEVVMPGGGLVVATAGRHPARALLALIVAPVTFTILTTGLSPGMPPVYGIRSGGVVVVEQLFCFRRTLPHDHPVGWVNASCRNTRTELGAPAAAPAESSTRTENEKVPAVVGFPVVLPLVDRVRPGGIVPPWMDHL